MRKRDEGVLGAWISRIVFFFVSCFEFKFLQGRKIKEKEDTYLKRRKRIKETKCEEREGGGVRDIQKISKR